METEKELIKRLYDYLAFRECLEVGCIYEKYCDELESEYNISFCDILTDLYNIEKNPNNRYKG